MKKKMDMVEIGLIKLRIRAEEILINNMIREIVVMKKKMDNDNPILIELRARIQQAMINNMIREGGINRNNLLTNEI